MHNTVTHFEGGSNKMMLLRWEDVIGFMVLYTSKWVYIFALKIVSSNCLRFLFVEGFQEVKMGSPQMYCFNSGFSPRVQSVKMCVLM